MLKFFRNIRHALIQTTNGKPASPIGKYFLYAIGEIFLVVIGILIALSINNWNESRKDKNQEREFLMALQSELERDLDDLYTDKGYQIASKASTLVIIDHLENEKPYHDSLDYHFSLSTYIWFLTPTGSVYESIKSHGLNIISNDNLRDIIALAYGQVVPWLGEQGQKYHETMMHGIKHLFNTRFEDVWNTDYLNLESSKMTPLDYNSLIDDQEYLYFMKSLPNFQFYYIDFPTERLELLFTRMLAMIEDELKESVVLIT